MKLLLVVLILLSALPVNAQLPRQNPSRIHDRAASPVLPEAFSLNPGTESATVTASARLGNDVYFLIEAEAGGGLWKTDGTTTGTQLIKAGKPGSHIIAHQTNLYFALTGDDAGMELWKSDGTTAGTVRVANINRLQDSPLGDSNPRQLTVFNNFVYFTANDGVHGNEIWQTDGTAAGTKMVANINTQKNEDTEAGADPEELLVFQNHLVFTASDGVNGRELWRLSTDNIAAIVNNSPGNANPQELTIAGNNLFYSAATNGQDPNGTDQDEELIRVDRHWHALKIDIAKGAASSTPTNLFAWGGDLYFGASGAAGRELFRANSNQAFQIADLNPGITAGKPNGSSPSDFALINDRLVFAATTLQDGREVWAYSGSGTPIRISQIAPGTASATPVGLTTVNGSTYFAASSGNDNFELYQTSDGINVSLVRDINIGNMGLDPSVPFGFTDAGAGKTLFSAFTNRTGMEPFITDGTAQGTVLLKDTNPLPRGGVGAGVTLHGWTYFVAEDADKGRELFRTDGHQLQLVSDIVPGVASSNPSNPIVAGNFVYFSAMTSQDLNKLWRTDGKTTEIVGHVNAENESDSIGDIVATNDGNVFFTASTDAGISLRLVRGRSLPEVKNFGQNGFITEIKALGNAVYLSARDSTETADLGLEPWRATVAGAVLLDDINPGQGRSSNPYEFVQTDNGDVYFAANHDAYGYELYRSIGGTGKPRLVIRPQEGGLAQGANGSNLTKLTAIGNEVLFAGYSNRARKCDRPHIYAPCKLGNWQTMPEAKLKIWRTSGTDASSYEDDVFNLSRVPFREILPTDRPDLEYLDYLSLIAVKTPAGSAAYIASSYLRTTSYAKPDQKGQCDPSQKHQTDRPDSRYVLVSPVSSTNKIIQTAYRINNALPVTANKDPFYPGRTHAVADEASFLSVSPGDQCISIDMSPTNQAARSPFQAGQYDPRLLGYEGIMLDHHQGVIYIAGWKVDRYEVWSMPHSEVFQQQLLPTGGIAPRKLNYIGALPNIERGTLRFQGLGDSTMAIFGFDPTSSTWKAYRMGKK